MRIRHKPWAKDYLAGLPFFVTADAFSFDALPVDNYKGFTVEIGVGKGEFLSLLAKKYPTMFFVGIELNASVLSLAAQKIESEALPNVLLVHGDALIVLPKIARDAVDYIVLNHSDPWPKKRHEKRRLTFPTFVSEYYRVLKPEGVLRFKSDNLPFSEYTKEIFETFPFKSLNVDHDYEGADAFDAVTEYENKFRAQGVKINRIIAEK